MVSNECIMSFHKLRITRENELANDNIRKKHFSGVSSPGFKWENKIYKLNRSIFVEGVAKRPGKKSTLSCCNSAELSVLKTILEQKAQHQNANLRKNKDGDNVLKVV